MSSSTTVCEEFQRTSFIAPDDGALRTPGDAVSITWREYADRVRRIAAGLDRLGLRRGDTLALMLTNRPEFALVDTAAMHLGAISFSVYNTSSPEQLTYVFTHAENRIVVTERSFLARVQKAGVAMEHVVCVDGPADGGTCALADLEQGAPRAGFDFESSWRAVRPDDLCTLIYTSGTTGPPKGVEITHANVLAQIACFRAVASPKFGDRWTSFLPAAHIADRVTSLYLSAVTGSQVTYVDDPKAIVAALVDCRPHLWFAVPRVWEKIRAGIEAKINAERDEHTRTATWEALAIGRLKVQLEQRGESLTPQQRAQWSRAEAMVLANLRSAVGLDQCRVAWTGAAALAPGTVEFFVAMGVNLCEIWGMSELTGLATVNPPERNKIGTIGPAALGMEIKLADDGEIMARGPLVMRGYRKDPARTAETVVDGWVMTGDIATVDEDGYFTIVDRKKELIINLAGKNMSPTNIENSIKAACPLIGGIIAIGDNRPYNVALIALDPDAGAAYAERTGLCNASGMALSCDPGVAQIVADGVAAGNEKLSRVEQIKKYEILPTFWEPGGTELTPTMKLRRKPINEKYADRIESLYA
jgi:long-subunit acyl-CoA synthetase (AMP-forming)